MRLIYYTGLLRKLGVNVEMVKIGKYKSYPEQFTLSGPSGDSIEEHGELLAAAWKTLVEDVAAGRGREPAEMEEILGRGPFNAQEAHEAGLVDGVAYPDEVPDLLREETGKAVMVVESYWSKPWKPEAWVAGRKRVGVIVVDGGIVEGKSKKIPLLNIGMAGDQTLVDTIDDARKDPTIAAVVLRVESGGGSAVASDRIWRAVQKLAEKKPVVASLGGEAASGGYYIVAPATELWANPSTITGSIGLFYGKADLSGLLAKLDVGVAMLKEGGSKSDMESWHRPYTPEEIAYLEGEVNHFYNIFLERVAAGREKTREEVDAIGQGRIWTGDQAKDMGLVDGIGGLPTAIRRARALGKVPSWVPVADLTPGPGLLGKIVGMLSGGAAADQSGIVDLAALVARTAGLDAIYPTAWIMLREEATPAALSPLTIEMD